MYKHTVTDQMFMRAALDQAQLAFKHDEIPVGAVLVKDNEIVLAEHNKTGMLNSPLAHAEKLIIDRITASEAKFLQSYTLYVTLEPCMMCAGMMIWSRLGRLVFGAKDPKAGCVGSIYNVLLDCHFNHHPEIVSGIMADESETLLKEFFKPKR